MLTVKEAEANWAELLDRAATGEAVTIERADRRRLQLKALPELKPEMTEQEWFDWFDARTVPVASHAEDAVVLVRRMRGHQD